MIGGKAALLLSPYFPNLSSQNFKTYIHIQFLFLNYKFILHILCKTNLNIINLIKIILIVLIILLIIINIFNKIIYI